AFTFGAVSRRSQHRIMTLKRMDARSGAKNSFRTQLPFGPSLQAIAKPQLVVIDCEGDRCNASRRSRVVNELCGVLTVSYNNICCFKYTFLQLSPERSPPALRRWE